MQWLRRGIRGGALIAALAFAGALLPGCQTAQPAPPATMTVRPTLYEVRRGPTQQKIAWFTDTTGGGGTGSGQIVFSNGTIPEGASGKKLDVFVMVGTVDPTFDLCAVFKAELADPQHASWSGDINALTGKAACPP